MDKVKNILSGFIVIIAFAFLLIFLTPFLYSRILNVGNFAGIIICMLLIFKFGFVNKYNELKGFFLKRKFTTALWKIYSITSIIFTVYALLISGLMLGFSLDAPVSNSIVIVLGAKVNPNGASVALQGRIDGAIDYLNNNPDAKTVVTGGQGDDEPMTEAQCMYEAMINSGIDENRIFIEDKATNTYENIKFSMEIIEDNNTGDNLAIATDSYHQFRARIIAYKQGINTEIGAVNAQSDSIISAVIYPTYFVREWFAIPVEILK